MRQKDDISQAEIGKLRQYCEALQKNNESLNCSNEDLQKSKNSLYQSYNFAETNYQCLSKRISPLVNSLELFKCAIRNLWLQINSMYEEREAEFCRLKNCRDLYSADCKRKIETLALVIKECSKMNRMILVANEEKIICAREYQAICNQSSERIIQLDNELSQYKSGWNQMKEEMRTMVLNIQQLKTQCSITVEDNEHFMQEIRMLRSQINEYESSVNVNAIHNLEENVICLEKSLQESEREVTNLKEENERLIQHHNMKQKLQYHVKIKQENNELKEMLRISKEENSTLRQVKSIC